MAGQIRRPPGDLGGKVECDQPGPFANQSSPHSRTFG